jgi:hypothetical protein
MLDRCHRKIDIEIRPVEMMRTRELDISERSNCGLLEPWEVLERQEEFPPAEE